MAARAAAVSLAIDPAARPADVRQPGHMLGLEAAPAGTLERLGYTEAAVDLARMAGGAAAIISEVLSPTGGVADEDRLQSLVAQHGIPRLDVAEIARASAHSPEAFRISAETSLPTMYGSFKAIAISSPLDASPYVALTSGDVYSGAPLVSVHLRCVAGALRSKACSCGEQIDHAMQLISREGGILLHLPRQTTHDVAAGDEDLAVSAIADGELAALLLRRLGISRIRAIVPSLLMEPGPEFGLDIVDAVDLKEALS
jgi:3,4-dihydroxy 2-butanone 4-phosphate synthase/GTP cyclohydrolase II